MNDLYIKSWMEGGQPQETDIHWRSKKGKASFNWRLKFPLMVPMKFPRLHLQMWDKDVVKFSDCIAETQLDLGRLFAKAAKTQQRVKLFMPVPGKKGKKDIGVVHEEMDFGGACCCVCCVCV